MGQGVAGWRGASRLEGGRESNAPSCVGCQDGVLNVADRGCDGTQDGPHDRCRENSAHAVEVCTVWGGSKGQGGMSTCCLSVQQRVW